MQIDCNVAPLASCKSMWDGHLYVHDKIKKEITTQRLVNCSQSAPYTLSLHTERCIRRYDLNIKDNV